MRRSINHFLAAAAAVLMALSAVPATAAVSGRAGPYRLELTTDPEVIPSSGRANLRISVRDSSGKPVLAQRVTALAAMPGMPMGEREEEAVPQPGTPGLYVAPANFPMAGRYEITVKVTGPQGSGAGSLSVNTGQNTGGGTGGFSFLTLLLWAAGLLFAGWVLLKLKNAWRLGSRPRVRGLMTPGVIAGIALLTVMFLLSAYAVNNWRRKGAMTPIEAQAADMSHMPPPQGTVAVTLAEVERGPVAASVRYTGTAMGFVEQDIYPRTQGWITWMPFYSGDRVQKGQLLAKLDTSELDSRVAQQEAARRMAEHQAMVSQQGYRQSLATAAQAKAEITSKQGMLQDARQKKVAAEAMLKQARHEMAQARGEVAESRESLSAAAAERSEAQADLAAAQTMLPDADAQLAAAQADHEYLAAEAKRAATLLQKGVVAAAEYQKDRAAAQNAKSKVDQAAARIRQVQEQVRSAEAKMKKADAMERAANARIGQMQSRFDASQAKIEQAQAEIAASEGRIGQAAADVDAAKANARAMESAAEGARQQIAHSQAGVSEAQAAVATIKTVKGYTEIRSLVDGVITQRNISPGVLVGPGQSILKVSQIRPIRIQANVPESDLARIRKGNRVRIRSQGKDAREATAQVSAVFPTVDAAARTGIVEALLPNEDRRFLPGQFVTMEIITDERPDALRVPASSVLWRTEPSQFGQSGGQQAYMWLAEAAKQEGSAVYTCPMHLEVRSDKPGLCPKCKMDLIPEARGGKWKARRVDVSVGISDGRFTEITSGLKDHDHVVLSGHQGLRDGHPLSPTNEPALAAGRGAAPSGSNQAPPAGAASKGRYYCPMHPEVTSDDPNATCAKCNGMKLVPRPEGS